ncbi:MAG: DUF58 domain-containing protein [Oscillospiraceae bacterium]|nr:DUF58 domain-containing protein [Oscillospiraceae bacterium]
MFHYRLSWFLIVCASALYALFDSGYLSFVILAAVFVFPAVSLAFFWAAIRKIEVKATAHTVVSKEETIVLNVHLRGARLFPISMAELHLNIENVLVGEERKETLFIPVGFQTEETVQFRFHSRFCGKITVEIPFMRYYDMLGIFTRRKQPGPSIFVFVLPKRPLFALEGDEKVRPGRSGEAFSNQKSGNDSGEVFDVRPFRETDRLRSIHWKLSMKWDQLITKEFGFPEEAPVLLILELLAQDALALDTAVESIAVLSGTLLDRQVRHRVKWYDARAGRLQEKLVLSQESLMEAICSILSAGRYRDKPYALTGSEKGAPSPEGPYMLYITGCLTEDLVQFCRGVGEAITVLHCGRMSAPERQRKDQIASQGIQILEIVPGTAAESLSALEFLK